MKKTAGVATRNVLLRLLAGTLGIVVAMTGLMIGLEGSWIAAAPALVGGGILIVWSFPRGSAEAKQTSIGHAMYDDQYGAPSRQDCQCCGYPTLDERNGPSSCLLCDWDPAGGEDQPALPAARRNFVSSRSIYGPGKMPVWRVRSYTQDEQELLDQLVSGYEETAVSSEPLDAWEHVQALEHQFTQLKRRGIDAG